jgi:hypothetical protein
MLSNKILFLVVTLAVILFTFSIVSINYNRLSTSGYGTTASEFISKELLLLRNLRESLSKHEDPMLDNEVHTINLPIVKKEQQTIAKKVTENQPISPKLNVKKPATPTSKYAEYEALPEPSSRKLKQKKNEDQHRHLHIHHEMNCTKSFEPTCDMYPYVRFWNRRFYPNDCYESPLRPITHETVPFEDQKYVVFMPDQGGWNNIRMAAEVAIIFAHATGRTLVLPPAMKFYLLEKNQNFNENLSTFATFFDLKKISESMTIISMQEFLENVAAKGLLKKPLPFGVTPSSFLEKSPRKELWDYLESACYCESWQPGKQFIGFHFYPNVTVYDESNRNLISVKGLRGGKQEETKHGKHVVFGKFHKQSPRFKEMVAHGRQLRPYDESIHSERAIYFPGDYRDSHRILTHYYTYLYWENQHIQKIYKRIVRDRLHYHDIIFCTAGYIVKQIHNDASKVSPYKPIPSPQNADRKTLGGNSNLDATYYAYHIRRGDFQYEDTRMSAESIWENTKHLLNSSISSLIYIATDEKNKQFFKPFLESGFTVKFLDDYMPLLLANQHHIISSSSHNNNNQNKFNMNHVGMVEQVIAANAHTFIGTPYSTFTGYITRMRGKPLFSTLCNHFFTVLCLVFFCLLFL